MNGQIAPRDLMRCLLYWDKILYAGVTLPGGGSITGNHPPEIQYLERAGLFRSEFVDVADLVLSRSHSDEAGTRIMGLTARQFQEANSVARLRVVKALLAKGEVWALGQLGGERLSLPGAEKHELIEATLHDCLPVPVAETAFDDLLEFKSRYGAELIELRHHLDHLREQILSSVDERRAIEAAIYSLHKAMRAVDTSLAARGIRTIGSTVSLYTANPAFGFWSAIGAGAATALGAPAEVGLSVGGATTTLFTFAKRLIGGVPEIHASPSEFSYVYRLANRFPSFGTAATR